MSALGWTEPKRFRNKNRGQLIRAVARYHAFLHLLSENPRKLLVPTLVSPLISSSYLAYDGNCRTLYVLLTIVELVLIYGKGSGLAYAPIK